jgi:hypothetical protein
MLFMARQSFTSRGDAENTPHPRRDTARRTRPREFRLRTGGLQAAVGHVHAGFEHETRYEHHERVSKWNLQDSDTFDRIFPRANTMVTFFGT